ncbi:alpha/beta fold hydrolase [Seonamhaeicola aphaedonensis]|uniref:Pimeloyl-ACP methyl ester carboxylesterase n=1 Tax=Seonamhaeicola aphaedonensis TaxID=1461338 RepID=A0A3D9HLT3_9FLAO|nr:alpha/beta hydrolase [Seonamhaeicola aphaedonensis]RED50449.1 pimeloyl-ACP methyl ester carboxylesterase [Seonamhaeicola aphaedonensis]
MILEYKGIDIFYTDYGKGSTIVLLHGFLENSNIWKPFIPQLSKKNRVVCIDLLGHGQTGCLGYIHTMELMSEIAEVVLKHLKIRKSTFIGHSMGGYVALAFAEKNPDNVKGLCLMNSTARADTPEKQLNRDRGIEAVKQNHKTFIRIAIANLFSKKNQTLFSKEIKSLTKECLNTPLQGIIAALEGMKIREDREVLLHFSPYKKMMIIGKQDPALDYNSLKAQSKNTEVIIVELEGGHMSFIENKDDFLNSIMHFIEKK